MNVTRDVMKDLVTIYLAGEASGDTRALVEEHLKSDPALAREVEAARAGASFLPPAPAPEAAAERRALEATRQLLKARTATLVVAAVFTLLPLTFVFHGSSVTFLLIRDAPVLGLAWWATAAVMWISHVVIRLRLRVSGL
jgi:anti-sigma factor RsiW